MMASIQDSMTADIDDLATIDGTAPFSKFTESMLDPWGRPSILSFGSALFGVAAIVLLLCALYDIARRIQRIAP